MLTAVQQDGGRLESVPSSPVLTLPVQSHPYLVFSVEIVPIRMSGVKISVFSVHKRLHSCLLLSIFPLAAAGEVYVS